MELRDLVCRVTGMHPTDAVQWLARAPGTWPQPLEETTVRELLDGFYEAGIAAEAWRTDLFPDLSPPRTIHRAACMNEGFRIEGLRGEPTHWVPWDRIELICAGTISAEDEFRNVQSPRWPSTVVSGIRALALMKPQPDQPPRPGHANPSRSGRRGDHRPPRPTDRIPRRRKSDELRLPGRAPQPSAAENFPVFLADLCAGPTRLTSPPPPARSSSTASPASTSSRARRRFSSTRPTDCSGAGIAAIAKPNLRLTTQMRLSRTRLRRSARRRPRHRTLP